MASASPSDGVTSHCFEEPLKIRHSQERHGRCKCSFVQRDSDKRDVNVIQDHLGDIRRGKNSSQVRGWAASQLLDPTVSDRVVLVNLISALSHIRRTRQLRLPRRATRVGSARGAFFFFLSQAPWSAYRCRLLEEETRRPKQVAGAVQPN